MRNLFLVCGRNLTSTATMKKIEMDLDWSTTGAGVSETRIDSLQIHVGEDFEASECCLSHKNRRTDTNYAICANNSSSLSRVRSW